MTKLKIRKGDNVQVIAGNDKGKTGRVLQVVKDKSRVIVEGVQMVTKHTKPSAENPNGGIVKKEAAIHISNVMLLDPSTGKPTKIGRKVNDQNKLQRVAKITGEFIKDEQS